MQRFKTSKEVFDFLKITKQTVYSLDNFKKFMNDMNNPQLQLKCIHIGGTNGKGSTTNYVCDILMQQGYNVGTYTSPYLINPSDNICINHQPIDSKYIVDIANRYIDQWIEYQISKFEIEVFIAIMYFCDHKIDFVIFEVGLGGLYDATNIISPLISAITNISLDHEEYLGNNYIDIAKNKAGIIKYQTDLITAEKKQECIEVFKHTCHHNHSQLIQINQATNIMQFPNVGFTYNGYIVKLNTLALYQVENACLSIEIILYLKRHYHINIEDKAIIEGLYKSNWKGRFEVMMHHPFVVIDGAHNVAGIDKLVLSCSAIKNPTIIFAALKDKNTNVMLEKLLTISNHVIVTEFNHFRAKKAKDIAYNYPVEVNENWQETVDKCLLESKNLIITGSLYFIQEVRKYLLKKGDATIN